MISGATNYLRLGGRGPMFAILFVHAGLLAWGAWRHSPTLGETPQLPAGIIHWRECRFDIYRVNPPLVRMVAAVPAVMAGARFDSKNYRNDIGDRPEFTAGVDFVAANGTRSFWLFTLARWTCIPFSLLGACVCRKWACELYGAAAGFVALALWCFSPDIIAHGQMITPDCAAAAMGVTAGYAFWHWLKRPTWPKTLGAGGALGVVELVRSSWLILFGVWPLLWLVWQASKAKPLSKPNAWLPNALQLAVVLILGVFILNLGYGFGGTGGSLGQYRFVSRTLTNSEGVRLPTENRFAGTLLGRLPVPLPDDYVHGIDLQMKDFEHYSWPSYLRGESSPDGWWYFYIYGLAVKMPIGTWLLLVLGIAVPTATAVRHDWMDTIVLLAHPAALLVLVSSQTAFSIHFRYLLPIVPFLFIWISRSLPGSMNRSRIAIQGVVLAIVWSVVSSMLVYPHNLSYFNELAGGPRFGHFHMVSSAIDWGQDLLYLRRWLVDHPEARPLHLAYYGYFDPKDAGITYVLPPGATTIRSGDPAANRLTPGWYAVSVTLLRGIRWYAPQNAYTYFQQVSPQATAGYSIYIYHLMPEDVRSINESMKHAQ